MKDLAERNPATLEGTSLMVQAVIELQHDHRAIQNVMAAMSTLAGALEAGDDVSREVLRDLTRFVDTFADQCHHQKEEKYLFPLLQKKDAPEIHAKLRKLADEHRTGRGMASEFERSVVGYLAHRPGGRDELVRAIRQLAMLYNSHIESEERVLLPLVEETLSPKEQNWLRDKFSEVEWYIGLDVHRNYEVLADSMKHWLPASASKNGQPIHV